MIHYFHSKYLIIYIYKNLYKEIFVIIRKIYLLNDDDQIISYFLYWKFTLFYVRQHRLK